MGNQTITVTDTVSSYITGTSGQIGVIALPVLSVSEGYSGTFKQGVTGGTLTVTVSNTGVASSTTSGTTTVTETLPTGYTVASFSGSGWSCSGTNAVTCTSTQAVAGGASFNAIGIEVSVPANAPNPTVTNAATASGGTASASATSGTVSFPVVQVPATMTAGSGTSPQSTAVNTAFGTPLSVTVTDAAGVRVSGVSVTFTAPVSGVSGSFSNSTNTITVTTNPSAGVASSGSFTANLTVGGPYTVTATLAGLTPVNFSLTNTAGAPTLMAANAGTTPQSAAVSTAFGNALAVTVKDVFNNPVPGVSVTFTAPASGASGSFGNSSPTIAVTTNASGVASAPFTANSTPGGPYTVTATSTGLTLVNFSLTNSGVGPQVTKDPLNQTVGAGGTATFTAAATGTPAPTVQWQVSTNGGASFSNVPGAISTTLSFTTSASQNGYQYRAVFTNTGGSATTKAATLTVNAIPTVVSFSVLWGAKSYNVIGTSRNRLPWQITGIQVVFSAPIASGNLNSLGGTGVTPTGFSGLGTNTLTWTISPLALGNFPATLAGSGANALKDTAGTALAGGAGFSQNLKILYGDFNDDGVVNSQDLVLEAAAISAPYNILADMNGDGVVSLADYLLVRSRLSSSLP